MCIAVYMALMDHKLMNKKANAYYMLAACMTALTSFTFVIATYTALKKDTKKRKVGPISSVGSQSLGSIADFDSRVEGRVSYNKLKYSKLIIS